MEKGGEDGVFEWIRYTYYDTTLLLVDILKGCTKKEEAPGNESLLRLTYSSFVTQKHQTTEHGQKMAA